MRNDVELSEGAIQPFELLRNPKWLAGVALGGALLGIAAWSAFAGNGGEPESARAAPQLEPGRFVLTETSWSQHPAPRPVAASGWIGPEGSVPDAEEQDRERLAQQARERWQNLDIAVRGQ